MKLSCKAFYKIIGLHVLIKLNINYRWNCSAAVKYTKSINTNLIKCTWNFRRLGVYRASENIQKQAEIKSDVNMDQYVILIITWNIIFTLIFQSKCNQQLMAHHKILKWQNKNFMNSMNANSSLANSLTST